MATLLPRAQHSLGQRPLRGGGGLAGRGGPGAGSWSPSESSSASVSPVAKVSKFTLSCGAGPRDYPLERGGRERPGQTSRLGALCGPTAHRACADAQPLHPTETSPGYPQATGQSPGAPAWSHRGCRPTLQPPPPHRWTAAVPWAAWPRLLLASQPGGRNLSEEPRSGISEGSPKPSGSGGRGTSPTRGPGAPEHLALTTSASGFWCLATDISSSPTSSSHLAITGSVSHLMIFPSSFCSAPSVLSSTCMQLPVPFSMTFCCLKRNKQHTQTLKKKTTHESGL